nr:unnamed protein product [Naegleria fowleri]
MRFTKRDISRLLFKNVSPFKLILHGTCIGICLLPAIAVLIVGLVVFITSPSDSITSPATCIILSKLQCITNQEEEQFHHQPHQLCSSPQQQQQLLSLSDKSIDQVLLLSLKTSLSEKTCSSSSSASSSLNDSPDEIRSYSSSSSLSSSLFSFLSSSSSSSSTILPSSISFLSSTPSTNDDSSSHASLITTQCTYSVSFNLPSSSEYPLGETIKSSIIPFSKNSPYANYSMQDHVPCFYDPHNPKNVSFEKTNLIHFYTIVGLGVIGAGACLLLLVLISVGIFCTNFCRFCVEYKQTKRKRRQIFRKSMLYKMIMIYGQNSSSGESEDGYTSSSSNEGAMGMRFGLNHSSSIEGILNYGSTDHKRQSFGNGYYYSNANKSPSKRNSGINSSGSSHTMLSSMQYQGILASTHVLRNDKSFHVDEKYFYQHSDDEDHENTLSSSSVEDVTVEIVSTPTRPPSFPAQNNY